MLTRKQFEAYLASQPLHSPEAPVAWEKRCSRRLREARKAAGLTLTQARQRAGISKEIWYDWEYGSDGWRIASLERIETIAYAVNTTPEHLLGTESPHVHFESHSPDVP